MEKFLEEYYIEPELTVKQMIEDSDDSSDEEYQSLRAEGGARNLSELKYFWNFIEK